MIQNLICASMIVTALISVGALAIGLIAGIFIYSKVYAKKTGKSKATALKIIEDAYAEAKIIKKEASIEAKEEVQNLKTKQIEK